MGLGQTINYCPEHSIELLGQAQKQIQNDRKNNIELYLTSIGISKRYVNCTLENFKGGEKYVKFCKNYVKNPIDSLFFTGTFGCGKTHLSIGICRELILSEKIYSARFTTGAELLLKIRSGFSDNKPEEQTIDEFTKTDFLFIDDLGAEKTTEWSKQTLYLIIDRRDRDLKTTIITSNLSLEEIEENISGRIASRIANSVVINVNLPDYRKKRV